MRQFEQGKASIYAIVAKDQVMSYHDLGLAATSSRENHEIETSARSQREVAEAKGKAKVSGVRVGSERRGSGSVPPERKTAGDVRRPVASAPTLVDARMDEHWREVSLPQTLGNGNQCAMPRMFFASSSSSGFFVSFFFTTRVAYPFEAA